MDYRYDANESSLRGRYECHDCGNIFFSGEVCAHKTQCLKQGVSDSCTFVFGPNLVQMALSKAKTTGDEDSVVYGGLTVRLIREICPEVLAYYNGD